MKSKQLTYTTKTEALNYIENRRDWWLTELGCEVYIDPDIIENNVTTDEEEKIIKLKITYDIVLPSKAYVTDNRTITYTVHYLK